MKELFREYYRPSESDFDNLWQNCFFTLDASVLLSLYRYKKETRDAFIQILQQIKDRLWLSNQATLEYFQNRLMVIKDQADAYDKVIKQLESSQSELATKLSEFSRHSAIDIDEIKQAIDPIYSDLRKKWGTFVTSIQIIWTTTQFLQR